MKKSTLITTIAMIVVVVVALSTATYAWFSSSTTSTAKTTIQTNATSGWMLSQGTIGTFTGESGSQTAPVSFSAAATQIVFDADMQGGLFSPKAVVDLHTSSNEATSVTINKAGLPFYECKKYGSTVALTKDKELLQEKDDPRTVMTPVIIRIANNNQSNSDCYVDVIVSIGSQDSKALRYAASAMTFVMVDGTGKTYTVGYSYALHDAEETWGGTGAPTDAQKVTVSPTEVEALNIDTTTTGKGLATRPAYNDATSEGTTSGFLKCTKVDTNFGDIVPKDSIYLKYRVNLGNVAKGAGINLVIYSWMDGWKADDAAAGSQLQVVFSFGGGSAITGSAVTNI